jgi:hypothetical protein
MEAKKKFKHKRNHKATEWIDGLPIRFLKDISVILVGRGDVFEAIYPFRVTVPLEKDDEFDLPESFWWLDEACREAKIPLPTPLVRNGRTLQSSYPFGDCGKTGRIGYIEDGTHAVFGCKTQKDADFVRNALVKGKLLYG